MQVTTSVGEREWLVVCLAALLSLRWRGHSDLLVDDR